MTSTRLSTIAAADIARLAEAKAFINANDNESIIAAAVPLLSKDQRAALALHTVVAHVALLIFPDVLEGLSEELAQYGINVITTTPSVIVRNRLSSRYAVPTADLQIDILRAQVVDRTGRPCELEIFAMAAPTELRHIAEDERKKERENHVALAVPQADPILLNGLRTTLASAMHPDGGGYNHYEDSTVLYFRGSQPIFPTFRRLELISVGKFEQVLAVHQRESEPGITLLRLMSGAWATQAIAAAVELCLPDHLNTLPDLASLAAATGADKESLARLLRYLTALGIIRLSGKDYTLTEVGTLLRSNVEGSMRPLALMYGGPFYESFAKLADAVRNGTESYAKVFGAHHFAHMAANPDLAELFHQSMAASNAIFMGVARTVNFSTAHTVIDIAGGNGELLCQVLDANPHLQGVLLDRPHALVAAESTLAHLGARCTLISGDFTETIPATGDVYLLSRVLHDWNDSQCHDILTVCATNMPEHAELLVIERLLPESELADSLAIPWDIHMLCNTGGQERTESHYRKLLAEAGFELIDVQPLPLDTYVLRARLGHQKR